MTQSDFEKRRFSATDKQKDIFKFAEEVGVHTSREKQRKHNNASVATASSTQSAMTN